MKKHFLLLALLTSLSLTGCDALTDFFNKKDTPADTDGQDGDGDGDTSKDPVLESIYIAGNLAKTEYIVGEKWSKEGLSVGAKWSDGNDAPLEEDKYAIIFDSDEAELGITSISATAYLLGSSISSEPVSYLVTVKEKEVTPYIESITIKGSLEKTHYYVGELWNTSGIWVEAAYSNGDKKPLDSSEYSFNFNYEKPVLECESLEITAFLVNGDLESEAASFDVVVEESTEPLKELENLEISGSLTKTFYEEGDDWSYAGLEVYAVYDDGSKEKLSNGLYYFEFNPEAPSVGVNSVSVQAFLCSDDEIYSNEELFDVTVRCFTELKIIGSLEQTSYEEDENWNFDGLQVEGTYNDAGKTSVILDPSEYNVEYSPEKAELGTTSLSIKVSLKKYSLSTTKSFSVSVYEHEVPPSPGEEYTILYSSNGGQGEMAPTVGENPAVANCTFTAPEDHHFDHWNSAADNSGTTYYVGSVYHENLTLYAIWEENSGDEDTYYKACEGLSGSSLQSKLKDINAPKSPSYDWDRYEDADEALDDSTCILSIYTRHNIKKGNHCGNYAWDKWNREHVWTQSAYPKSASDNHNIFACEGQINGYRGNKPFAEGGETVVVFGHTTGCKQTNNTFEPCDEAKGEIARSVMYGTVQYSYTMTNEIKSIALALKWHLEHPITERDTRRNEVVYENQGNRNPFVDHPEYACKIWGNTNSETKALCGMN